MICAIDFGSCWIRSVFRTEMPAARLAMCIEKAEYASVTDTEMHRRALVDQRIPFAECDGMLMIAGNQATRAQWLSRVPCAPLLCEGQVPTDDPPARQMLSLLTEAMLPQASGFRDVCAVIFPGVRDESGAAAHTEEFLSRIIRQKGFHPFPVNPGEAALLASGGDSAFTGISIVIGGESTAICVARFGVPVITDVIPMGANWADAEIARQFRMQMFNDDGACYLDLEAVRSWKSGSRVHLQRAGTERDRALVRLYTVMLDRIARTVNQLLNSSDVLQLLQRQRLPVLLSGGGSQVDGIAGLMTERLAENQIAEKVLSVRVVPDAATAVIRGALIAAELELRACDVEQAA